MGKELVSVLYARNATVYCACRSEEKARKVIDEIVNSTCPSTNTTQVPTRTATTAGELGADMRNSGGGNKKGAMHFLPLDLSDLSSVKFCAEKFLSREKKLHVLFNNAGVMTGPTPAGQPIPTTAQGHELALGFNCVGTFLLTRLLTPVLVSTANSEQMQSPGSVRVIWVSSFGLLQYAPFERGIDMDNLDYQREEREGIDRYGISKCGVWLLGVEFGRRYGSGLEGAGAGAGVTSVTINPGNLLTELARDAAWWISLWGGPFVISMPIPLLVAIHDFVYPFPHAPLNKDVMSLLYSSSKRILEWKRRYDTSANGNRPIFGVYTQLFAAFSPDLASNKVDWTREWGEYQSTTFNIIVSSLP